MSLKDIFVKNLKTGGKPAKHTDGLGLYLLVNTGKHWRMDYRRRGVRKTLAFGSYPAVQRISCIGTIKFASRLPAQLIVRGLNRPNSVVFYVQIVDTVRQHNGLGDCYTVS